MTQLISRYVKGVEYATLARMMTDFRAQLEREAGMPLYRLEASAADWLADLCLFFGFSKESTARVLGKSFVVVERGYDERIQLAEADG